MSSVEAEVKTAPVSETKEVVVEQPKSPPPATATTTDSHDEEYESADDAYEEEIEEIEVEEEVEDEEEVEEEEEEEEGGDREPQDEEDKELDDDEDVKNPQFIPKRGYFYEHDDRTKAEEEGEKEEEDPKKDEKKKLPPKDKDPDRWSHDLYKESEQTPKSKEELSRAYGYDIWTEDQAPRARRRRRYGRGPSKYTRNWEEEEAYRKPRGGFRGRGGPRGRGGFRGGRRRSDERSEEGQEEEFPALPGSAPVVAKSPAQPLIKEQTTGHRDQTASTHPNDRKGESRERERPTYDHRRKSDEFERGFAPRGSGPRGGRGRGRRNEFSNRNRYPNRRDEEERHTEREREHPQGNRPRPNQSYGSGPADNRGNRGPANSHQHTNGYPHTQGKGKEGSISSNPPFTNTEYTGSHSLTAGRHENLRKGPQSNILAEKGYSDLRELINAKKQQQQQPPHSAHSDPHRSQQPPRSQVQGQQHQQSQGQGPQVQHMMPGRTHHTQGHPNQATQHKAEQGGPGAGKPKRFSARQQRGTEQQGQGNANSGVTPQTSGGPVQAGMGHVPNMIPVVSGAEQMVPSPVPGYPQPPTYYEGAQVYETSGSPVTVSTNGTSVSPSLWAPHAYAAQNAPYPSPPTGPQVPPAAYADHAAYLAAQQGAPPMYSAPPQFIQDPALMNYNTAAPPFTPTFHPQAGFQGYPPVAQGPPPEMYHGGVTYYNPQPQIHPRQAPVMSQQHKRTKTVLQLVEPPEKTRGSPGHHKDGSQPERHSQSQSPPTTYASDTNVHGHVEPAELVQQFEGVSLNDQVAEQPVEQTRKSPNAQSAEESWSAQMDDSPESSFQSETQDAMKPKGTDATEPTPHPKSAEGTTENAATDCKK